MPAATTTPARPDANASKPRLRGWLHLVAVPVALVAGLVLVVLAATPALRASLAVYLVSAVVLFGTSAVYHLGAWPPTTKAVLRRADHANIFGFIAGTYTPLAVSLLPPASATVLLVLIWSVALCGMAMGIFWIHAPRWVSTALYLATGWVALFWLPAFWVNGGPAIVILVAIGGVCYSLGAVAYALKRPNPFPGWFGFHEVFHLATVLAAACHFAAIAIAVL